MFDEENHHFECVRVCSVEDESSQYRLHVSGFSGTVEDSFSWYHDKQSFSTPDTGNICAEISHAGWWYSQCFYANLNGIYYKVWCGLLVIDTKVVESGAVTVVFEWGTEPLVCLFR